MPLRENLPELSGHFYPHKVEARREGIEVNDIGSWENWKANEQEQTERETTDDIEKGDDFGRKDDRSKEGRGKWNKYLTREELKF